MSADLQNIIIPLSYFYIRESPTYFTDISVDQSTGWPSTIGGIWTDVGATIGEGRFEYSRSLGMLELEGYSAPIKCGTYYQNETASITVPLAEVSYDNLYRIIHSPETSGEDIYFGGDTRTKDYQVLCVVESRAGNGKFHYFALFNAVLESTLSLSFSKSAPTTYEVTFRSVLDITQDPGKQFGKIHIES